jgi:mycothiol synthase
MTTTDETPRRIEANPADLPTTDGVRIAGLMFRRFRADDADYEALAALMTEANLADQVEWIPQSAQLRNEFEHIAGFHPLEDVLFAEADGQLVGHGQVHRDVRDGKAVYWTFGNVRPAYRRLGLGRALLRANERRLHVVAKRLGEEEGRTFGTFADEKQAGALALLQNEGYEPVRYYFTMRRPTLGDLPEIRLPDGLQLRPVEPSQHRAIFEADDEAFRDHWGHREATEEDYVARYAEPDLDTTLWRVAWDGDEVAGSVMSYIWRKENETLGVQRGWLEHISVRRPWRRRGLAQALIASALEGLRDAGMTEAMLGVDAENPTGAVRLYTSVGFEERDRGMRYSKAWS